MFWHLVFQYQKNPVGRNSRFLSPWSSPSRIIPTQNGNMCITRTDSGTTPPTPCLHDHIIWCRPTKRTPKIRLNFQDCDNTTCHRTRQKLIHTLNTNTHHPIHSMSCNDTAICTSAPYSISKGGDSTHSAINNTSTNRDNTTNRNTYCLTTEVAKYNPDAHAQVIT